MQLINESKSKKTVNKKNLKAALTLATTALLGSVQVSATPTSVAAEEDTWSFDSAFLYYSEADRVSAAEAVFNAKKTYSDDSILNLKLTVDALTGASANGAVAQPDVQTFTRPSGKGDYEIKAGETPLDDTFHDTRVQLNAQWTQALAPNVTGSVGGHLSKEYDYLSLGINGNIAYDFNKKNSTISFGLSHFQDTFTPEGGLPKPFASMPLAYHDSDDESGHDATRMGSDDDKTTSDIMVGFTQVINRRMVTQFNYSYSVVDGYLTDPFKVLSLLNNQGLAQDYLYENRPDKRTKQSVFAQTKYHFDETILDVSYRYMWDDWEIKSHTVDTRFYIPLGNGSYLEPHLRFYQQGAAQFYQPFLMEDDATPEFASADYRIGEMTAYTVGLKYGMKLADGNDLSFRLEYYRQDPKSAGHKAPGALADMEIYQSIDAIIAQVSYSF
ncbi:DUF3570 domain-containing protein [Colwellia hornerae]|uniref:DUF3570 domain-containing protein n=1 Tax=Colwellia hornerae TaxID=89402 RepID=A0A5C6QQI6_9GAMM|nr:DUF3570 domain-containing protein [Colwellia hornerae]TWX57674.1 DUF3570 domain-containing protein [Colwellia hornerae]TWX62595.1 DUF3570 domain-containing protein [Colwellia hornerae]TWX71506.1 DUF3570 domain-containing protein [Colwellia hornerae]